MSNSNSNQQLTQVPIIDVSSLRNEAKDNQEVAQKLRKACTEYGFFYISNHGISEQLQKDLERLSHQFFQLDLEEKMQIKMALGGKAWRGFFPVKGELTSGKPDLKEGIYFGSELGETDKRVQANWSMHGANLFPTQIPVFRKTVLEYIKVITEESIRLVSYYFPRH
ncbi:MAG: 2-oxoglutarate and iron-dependent oxygenase domain-containing protein [Saprospiraceae bacterium]